MSIGGTWYNELGSMMTITVSGSSISGTYNTASGSASGDYALVGRINQPSSASSGSASATGWTVAWSNSAHGSSNSTTSWTGLYQPPAAGTEEIYTLWLLATEMPEAQQWGAVHVGQDTFTRNPPSPQTVQQKLARGQVSHPASAAPKK